MRPATPGHPGRMHQATRSPALDPRVLLRREVGRFRARESRRVFDASVHVGVLDGPRDSFTVRAADLPVVDAALRTDVVSALLDDAPGAGPRRPDQGGDRRMLL